MDKRPKLYVVHPVERHGPETGGALSIICNNLSLLDSTIQTLAVRHDNSSYSLPNVRYVNCNSFILRVISKLLYRKLRLPYIGHVGLLLATLLTLCVFHYEYVVCFNDSWFAYHLAKWFRHIRFVVWYQNAPTDLDGLMRIAELPNVRFFTCSDWVGKQIELNIQKCTKLQWQTIRSGSFHEPIVDNRRADSPVSLLYVGRLDPNKGVDIAIDVLKSLVTAGIPCTLTVIGDTWFYGGGKESDMPYKDLLVSNATGLPVTFLGHLPHCDLGQYYRVADYLLVPSRVPEPAGLVAIEGMVNGCIVFGSNLGGLPEYLADCGVIVESTEPVVWSTKLFESIRLGEYLSGRLHRSDKAKSKFSWSQTLANINGATCED
jgi:glycosyltransferase involved in cell wall biosynthesis